MAKGQAGKNKCAIDITAAIASAGIAASLITISAMAFFKLPFVLVNAHTSFSFVYPFHLAL